MFSIKKFLKIKGYYPGDPWHKTTFLYFIIHCWDVQFYDEGLRFKCPLFCFEMGWLRPYNRDTIEQIIRFSWLIKKKPFWAFEGYEPIWETRFERIYDTISRYHAIMLENDSMMAWKSFTRKYLPLSFVSREGSNCLILPSYEFHRSQN